MAFFNYCVLFSNSCNKFKKYGKSLIEILVSKIDKKIEKFKGYSY